MRRISGKNGARRKAMESGFIDVLRDWCSPDSWLGGVAARLGDAGLPATLLIVGLVGSLGHCVGMCGPFVLAQVGASLARSPSGEFATWQRLRGGALLPYHLGRFTTYSLLGALGGGLAHAVVGLSGWGWLLAPLLLAAAALMVLQAIAAWTGPLTSGKSGGGWLDRAAVRLAGLTAPLTADPRGAKGYALGVALGFLPCGLLYGALAAAAGSGSPAIGALAMAAFALGTAPSLIGVGYAGAFFGRRWLPALRTILAPLMLVNALFLGFLALSAIV